MAQNKYQVSVTNGSQTVTVPGQNVAVFIKAGQLFMLASEKVPYFVALDATWDGTDTSFTLTGAYQGATAVDTTGVIHTSKTPAFGIPTLTANDVGTAAVFNQSMLRLEQILQNIPDEVLVDMTTDTIAEGSVNLFYTAQRVRQAILSGFAAVNALVGPADTVEQAISKLQGQHSAHAGSRNTAHATATTTEAGFLSATDKTKLDQVATPTVSTNPPASPINGQTWTSLATGVTYTWVVDGADAAWVQAI